MDRAGLGNFPAAYDEKNRVGRIVGGWEEEGLYKLNLKFKSPQETDEAKLWQFIGKDATSEDDYHQWSDYLNMKVTRTCSACETSR